MAQKHQIPQEIAQKVVNLLYEAINCNINVMGENGEIIATMQKERLGNIHEGGRRVVSGEAENVSIDAEMAKTMTGVLPGYMGPIELGGERIGCIGITGDPGQVKPIQKLAVMIITEELKKERLHSARQQIINTVAGKIQGASASIQEISAGAEEIAGTSQTMKETAQEIDQHVSDINRVVDLVRNIVMQTNLLGLNAAIEAARAGEYGRGFSIVAEEVRKLSVDSATSLQDISKTLDQIKISVLNITKGVEQTAVTTDEQATALQTVGTSIIDIQNQVMALVEENSADGKSSGS
ncbi:MAG: sugar diacid recognition domain-containing protein [Veillonellales bacterium]